MMERQWSWAGACSVGASHLKSGSGCDDSAACLEVAAADSTTLVAVVSDGAGSADYGAVGSKIVVRVFVQAVRTFLRGGKSVNEIDEGVASDWIDAVRDRVGVVATRYAASPRDFAATLVGVIVS